ncbi:ribose-5-phosphate isomerase RpiA [Paenibacillus crassostreae]|uniref:Ribose-5-phosphate isomerase A n=1 Tax=Paenibacillus crassostreae TaxID=1763538 RepID=A0A167FR56_9BACL|nr:ribose-5-phosphate isomerase RpiA [Paenibacillus crassostreae]AOZ94804.1 ribose 5-phosphate isomerase A [Paenibacillus crassostreae]OAB76817.1 ribose-5-phosphate isomerase [Paenibacillus crassostreae]
MNMKKIAAEHAVQYIEDGMKVGLGTGSTAYWAIQKLGQRVQEGLSIQAVATSIASEKLALELGIPIIPFAELNGLNVTIDGADEVNPELHLIKGGGGALLREKIVAYHSEKLIIIADESKWVPTLGQFPLPVEIIPFAVEWTVQSLEQLGCKVQLRTEGEQIFITDNQNYIADCSFGTIPSPLKLHNDILSIPGIVDNGLFIGLADQVIIGHKDGSVEIMGRK